MNFVGDVYYKLNRRLLLLVGLWPYEHSIYKYCQMIFCNIIVIFTSICQITKLISEIKKSAISQNIEIMLKFLSPIVVFLIYLIKYETFCIVAKKIKYLMDHVEEDWNMLKDKRELEILERYTYIGSMCTMGLTIVGFVAVLICILLPFLPNILDFIAPLNVSRPQQLLFPGEYFVDQQKFFYAISLQINITMGLILLTLIGTETLYVTYVQHACGMFEVASYRMAQAFNAKLLQDYTCEKQAIIICKRIIEAIRIHKRALEFSEFLWSTLAISYSILLIIGITSLIINLFCLFQAILFIKAIDQIITLSLFTVGHIIYLFLGNYVGQILIDHSAGIFQNIYCTQWQGTPLQAQQLLRIIMQRSMKSCKMDVGGMFTPSLEGFAALMSTTLSYFTVLWSVHK
ncbi:uncharacterized protein LOC105197964 isoform X2 [Solenopsis invicta]|uniref:uncharacterized protein LOC105197964 isoform X2 n=1 Tax=Solenopsis invicta TaxID=13686 RepID=UPI00193D17E3|nr:uncharacterized protein LOC105197964 isoform X2 [Solenopsis invicta]